MSKDRSGYVFQDKQGAWYARTTITDSSGKRRNVKRRAKDKADAKEILKTLLRQIDDEGSKGIDFAMLTFNHLAEYYAKHYLKSAEYVDGRKVAGLRDVKRVQGFLPHFRNYFGKTKLRAITYEDIVSYRSERFKAFTQYKRQRTIASMNRELAVLRRMLNIALRQGWILKNPFNCGDSLISVADERKRERILTSDEETRLLAACDEHSQRRHLRPLLVALLDTGARKSEMLKLRWRSVCFATRTITIEGMTTKTLKTRQVAMTTRLYVELQRLWEASTKQVDALAFGITDNVRHTFKSVCQAAGIQQGGIYGLNIHSLRHTAATRLVKGQMPLHMVGRILGHSQPQTTYRYLSADADAIAQAALILERFQSQSAQTQHQDELIN